jgi:hypothetical protein
VRRLIAQPATVIIGDHVFETVSEAWLSDEHDSPLTLEAGTYSTHFVDIGEVKLDVPGQLTAITAESGFPITVRNVEEDDTVAQEGYPSFPLPVQVIRSILSGQNMDNHLEALVGDDGFVNTMLLVTDVGLFVRYSSNWLRVYDVSPISNLNSVEVADEALDLYDAADNSGNMVPIASLPGPEKTTGTNQVSTPMTVTVGPGVQMTFSTEQEQVAVTASMAHIPIRIDDADDLPGAIAAAANDESLRWYVTRRARALRYEGELPWEQ